MRVATTRTLNLTEADSHGHCATLCLGLIILACMGRHNRTLRRRDYNIPGRDYELTLATDRYYPFLLAERCAGGWRFRSPPTGEKQAHTTKCRSAVVRWRDPRPPGRDFGAADSEPFRLPAKRVKKCLTLAVCLGGELIVRGGVG